MTITGKFGAASYDDQKVRGGHHAPVVMSGVMASGTDTLPAGLVVAKDADGNLAALAEMTATVAEGDGAEDTFAIDLGGPVEPGSVGIVDGVETFTDDGFGTLSGDGETTPGSGKIDYLTGQATVTFKTAPLSEADIDATWTPKPAGVLDEAVDLSASGSGNYIVHGSVRRAALVKPDGAGDYEAAGDALVAKLAAMGIWAE